MFSTVEVVQLRVEGYLLQKIFSTVGNTISSLEGVQYCEGKPQALWIPQSLAVTNQIQFE